MEVDRRQTEPNQETEALCPPRPLPLDPANVPVVYAAILRGVYERADLAGTKASLRAELGCSRSALDGVHAQFTKDLAAAYAGCPAAHQWGEPTAVLRLAARHFQANAGSGFFFDPLPGLREFVEAYGATCHRRGVGMLWETMVGGAYAWATVDRAGGPAGYRGAAHGDFDFPAKVEWRRAWEDFLKEHISRLPPDAVSRLRVLCLPSKDPRREISMYLRLGIRPENICAVEGNAEAAAELARNCRILGGGYERVRVIHSDLLRFLKRTKETFDVISLDFHGCAGGDKFEISRHIRPASTHYVLINLEAAREKPMGQRLIRESHAQSWNSIANMELRIARGSGQMSAAEADSRWIDQREDISLSEARDDGLDVMSLGHGHWVERSALSGHVRRFEELFGLHGTVLSMEFPHIVSAQAELDNHAIEAASMLARFVCEHALDDAFSTIRPAVIANLLYRQYQEAVYRPQWVCDLRRYGYLSEASNQGQTYLSTFAALGPGVRMHSSIRAVAEFLVEYAIHSYENFLNNPGFHVLTNQGVCAFAQRTRNGHVRIQAHRLDHDRVPLLEGPVLSSADILEGIRQFDLRVRPHVARCEELFSRPRVFLTGANNAERRR